MYVMGIESMHVDIFGDSNLVRRQRHRLSLSQPSEAEDKKKDTSMKLDNPVI